MRRPELWELVLRVRDTDECIVWNNCCLPGPRQYGQVQYNGRLWLAHRLSFYIHVGPVRGALDVCHSCDNPPCYNPKHLFLGTRKENMQDCLGKGRFGYRKGEKSGLVKLTEQQVLAIRAEYRPKTKGFGYKCLAKKYGMTPSAISAILCRRNWRHI